MFLILLAQASKTTRRVLAQSERQANNFCVAVASSRTNASTFRCNRSDHLTDWGPDPHWVAVVELLLASSARSLVIGGGFPYFKVSLAHVALHWQCQRICLTTHNWWAPTGRCATLSRRSLLRWPMPRHRGCAGRSARICIVVDAVLCGYNALPAVSLPTGGHQHGAC